jgi:hypothetical protein
MRFVPLFALLALAAPALAQETPGNGTAAEAKATEKMVCRRYSTTGTIMGGKKVCHTKAEWARLDGLTGREHRDTQRELGSNNRMAVERPND